MLGISGFRLVKNLGYAIPALSPQLVILMKPTLSYLEYLEALAASPDLEDQDRLKQLFSLMNPVDATLFELRCICLPMQHTDERGWQLIEDEDRRQMALMLGEENNFSQQEAEEKINALLASLEQNMGTPAQPQQPLLPILLLKRGDWLLLYDAETFTQFSQATQPKNEGDFHIQAVPLFSHPHGLSLFRAKGQPALWMFHSLERETLRDADPGDEALDRETEDKTDED